MASFETVKESVSLQEFCDDHLEARGQGFYVCPKCGSGNGPNHTAAFKVTGDHWKCYACDNGGDIFDLAGVLNGTTDKREQLRLVEEWAGTLDSNSTPRKRAEKRKQPDYKAGRKREEAYITACKAHIRDEEAVSYLCTRGIMAADAEALGLGYDPDRKRLVIPWEGSAYYHIDRAVDGAQPKYTKPKAEDVGPQPLYDPEALREPVFFLVEGAIDALAVRLSGYRAVALGGTGSRAVVEAISSRNPSGIAVVMLDSDEPGKKAAKELCRALESAGIPYEKAETETKDAGEWLKVDSDGLRAFLTGVYGKALVGAQERRETAYNEALRSMRAMNPADVAASIYMLDNAFDPIPTGFPSLDDVLGGGLQSGLYVLGAVSSLGKTTLAVQICDHIAESGHSALFVTIEQSATELVAKSLSRIASESGKNVSTMDIMNAQRRKAWDEAQYSRFMNVCDRYATSIAPNLRILEGTKQPTVDDVRSVAEAMAAHDGEPPVIFIDYLQLMASENDRDTDKQAADKNVMSLRQLARDLQTPVVVISSLNRSSYSEGVTMDAWKESGAIEYGADVLLGLQPEGMFEHMKNAPDKKQKREADEFIRACKANDVRSCELVILKNRAGRIPSGGIPFRFNAVASTFKEGKGAGNRSVPKL